MVLDKNEQTDRKSNGASRTGMEVSQHDVVSHGEGAYLVLDPDSYYSALGSDLGYSSSDYFDFDLVLHLFRL